MHGGWHVDPELAAAGLWTTPSDLARVILAVQASLRGSPGALLPRDLAMESVTPQPGGGYGLGWQVAGAAFRHTGGDEGYRCVLEGWLAGDRGVVVTTDGDGDFGLRAEVLATIAEALGWDAAPAAALLLGWPAGTCCATASPSRRRRGGGGGLWVRAGTQAPFASEGQAMKKRTGEPWMPADAYGRSLTGLSVDLIVRDVARSLPFSTGVLGLRALYHDVDFAALARPGGAQMMLHADHTYEAMPVAERVAAAPAGMRGPGAELRVMGMDPDGVQARADAGGVRVLVPATDFPHGWRECHVQDPDGCVWAVGMAI